MAKALYIQVFGLVQGVFYRDFTYKKAVSLGLLGTVKNNPNGSVEIYAQGSESSLNQLKEWCHTGSPHCRVDRVIDKVVELNQPLPSFCVIYR